jgi:protein-tyrosine sulfotransferase
MTSQDVDAGGSAPVFVLCAARTGSTLLRLLLDTHPQLASPPETHAARVCETLERTWRSVRLEAGNGLLPHSLLAEIGRSAAAPLEEYTRARGKRRWCDKSLDNVGLAPLLSQVYRNGQFVCLVRHCLDFVMSGIDASIWGFGGYGFEDYVRENPGNVVAALVKCWCDYNDRMLSFSEDFPQRSVRVRYEDLVVETDAVMAKLFAFLGVEPREAITAEAFSSVHDLGAGDHKIPFTDGVETSGVGIGRRVPVNTVPEELLGRMNGLLERLGYERVGPEWNLSAPGEPYPPSSDSTAARRVLGPNASTVDYCGHGADDGVLVVFEDLRQYWIVRLSTGAVSRCDRPCATEYRVVTDAPTLGRMVAGELNVGSALRSGMVRVRGRMTVIAGVVEALRALRAPAPVR